MAAPAPLLKPKFKTTSQADLFDAFEVETVQPRLTVTGRFEPRPRMAFDFDDAILALAEMLKAQGTTPEELAEQLGEHKLQVIQTRLLTCDGKTYEHMRLLNKNTHETIWARLEDYYGGAKHQPQATPAVETQAPVDAEEGTRMISMGTQAAADPVHPRDKPKKVLAVRTVYDGSGEREDRMKDAMKSLTADDIPRGGLVITMGKTGPKIVKAASAQTDEEEAEALLEGNEAVPVNTINTGARVQAEAEVTISRDPNPPIPGLPRPAPKVAAEEPLPKDDEPVVKKQLETRVMSGDAMDKVKPAAKVAHEAVVFGDDLGDSGMDLGEAGALIDAELGDEGETDLPEAQELQQLLHDPKADPDTRGMTQQAEHGGRRVQKQESVIRKDRGGTRPQRPAKV